LTSGIDDSSPWHALEARRADEARQGSPLLTAWQAFMQRQRCEALGRASAAAPLRLSACHLTDGSGVWHQDGANAEPVQLEAADPVTFRGIEDVEDSAEDAAWEALLDGLEEHGLLITFDKQDLVQAVVLCQAMASAAGLAGSCDLSDQSPGHSFLDIAIDFERWLEPRGSRLLWPRGSWRSSGDDHYPAAIVQAGSIDAVVQAAEGLGGGRAFAPTWSG